MVAFHKKMIYAGVNSMNITYKGTVQDHSNRGILSVIKASRI